MIGKIRLIFEQIKFMYDDNKLHKMCDQSLNMTTEKELVDHLWAVSRKFQNPDIIRIALEVKGNRWDDVFYKGFLLSHEGGKAFSEESTNNLTEWAVMAQMTTLEGME